MEDTIYRIELIRRLTQPRHTAFRTRRGYAGCHHRGRLREIAVREDKPPPAGTIIPHRGRLNALVQKAADFALMREIGGFFCFEPYCRCRGPPV